MKKIVFLLHKLGETEKKRILILSGIAVSVVLAIILCFVFLGNERTLEEITRGRNGGRLRYAKDEYTVVEIYFESNGKKGNEREGTCYVVTNYYKKASYSSSGKVFDRAETQEYPCKFTDYSLTIGLSSHYTYSVETRNEKEYVVFSKPFFGQKTWYVDK